MFLCNAIENRSKGGQLCVLFVQARGFLVLFIRGFADLQEVVVEPATFFKLLAQQIRLFPRGIQAVAERFTHAIILCVKETEDKRLKPKSVSSTAAKAAWLSRAKAQGL